MFVVEKLFQSARAVRRATIIIEAEAYCSEVSIRARRAARDLARQRLPATQKTFQSARAVRRATSRQRVFAGAAMFQSARAVRRATTHNGDLGAGRKVSIRARRAARDSRTCALPTARKSFNPRAPCGARQRLCQQQTKDFPFQSARAVRRATCKSCPSQSNEVSFNPRAPCGARLLPLEYRRCGTGFNPRAPCGARPTGLVPGIIICPFQSARAVRRATRRTPLPFAEQQVSIRARRAARDLLLCMLELADQLFQSARAVRRAT